MIVSFFLSSLFAIQLDRQFRIQGFLHIHGTVGQCKTLRKFLQQWKATLNFWQRPKLPNAVNSESARGTSVNEGRSLHSNLNHCAQMAMEVVGAAAVEAAVVVVGAVAVAVVNALLNCNESHFWHSPTLVD